MLNKIFPGIICLLLFVSCGSNNSSKEIEINMDDISQQEGRNGKGGQIQKIELTEGTPVYYNMYLTIELSKMFEKEGAVFEPQILNLVENTSRYISSSEKALNLGVYAVDLTYCRVYEQYQKAGSYFSAMYRLATELGIPEEFFYESADRIEKNISNRDSLKKITDEVYTITDKYLRENERENASVLIVVGGWVESIYLASKIFIIDNENNDIDFLKRIKEQEKSLSSIIKLLHKYKADNVINSLLQKLEELEPNYNRFEIYPQDMDKTLRQLQIINEQILSVREDIIL